MLKRLLILVSLILIGLFLAKIIRGVFVTSNALRNYEATFQDLDHPHNTGPIDNFKFKFSYYPATNIDETIKFRCAYLVGEIRSNSNDWDGLKTFYTSKILVHDNADEINVGIFPVEFDFQENSSHLFRESSNYSYHPFEYDVLEKLKSHYSIWGTPKNIITGGKGEYVVYIAPQCK